MNWIKKLRRLEACEDAIEWCQTQSSLEEAWNNCQSPRWLIWYAARVSGKRGSQKRERLAAALYEIAKTYDAESELDYSDDGADVVNIVNIVNAADKILGINATDASEAVVWSSSYCSHAKQLAIIRKHYPELPQ